MTKSTGNITIEIDGERFELSSLDNGTGHGEPLTATNTIPIPGNNVIDLGEGNYQLLNEGYSHRISVIEFDLHSRTCTIDMDGQVKQVRILSDLDLMIEKMGLNAGHVKKQSLMIAPMPGLVTDIRVTVGEHINKGAPLLILEAMKMENVIAAPHEAVIKDIKVTIGQAVERGLPLVEFLV